MSAGRNDDDDDRPLPTRRAGDALAPEPEEPPVVARMIIEIRSDGTRTVARGAMEDARTGERVSVQAEGSTPMALAASLANHGLTVTVRSGQIRVAPHVGTGADSMRLFGDALAAFSSAHVW